MGVCCSGGAFLHFKYAASPTSTWQRSRVSEAVSPNLADRWKFPLVFIDNMKVLHICVSYRYELLSVKNKRKQELNFKSSGHNHSFPTRIHLPPDAQVCWCFLLFYQFLHVQQIPQNFLLVWHHFHFHDFLKVFSRPPPPTPTFAPRFAEIPQKFYAEADALCKKIEMKADWFIWMIKNMSVCFVLAFLYKGNSFTQIKRTEPEVVLTMNNLLNDILDLSLEYLLSHTFLCLVFLVNFRKCSNTSILAGFK